MTAHRLQWSVKKIGDKIGDYKVSKHSKKSSHIFQLAIFISLTLTTTDGFSQEGASSFSAMDEVIVTSRYREESIQEVPDTIVQLDSQEITQKGINDLKDLTKTIPNMDFESVLHHGSVFINMRGINTMRGAEPGVSVYIDGIQATSPLQLSQELFDVESIEVLKGPQGALYGRSAIAGAINVTTKKPKVEIENVIRAGLADGNEYSVSAKSSGALGSEQLLYSVFASTNSYDGGIKNTFLDKEVDFRENQVLRGRLIWAPSEQLEIDATYNRDDLEGGTYYFSTIVNAQGAAILDAADRYDFPIQAESLTTGDRLFEEFAVNVTYTPDFGGTFRYSVAMHDFEEHYGMPGTAKAGAIDPTYGTGNYDMTPVNAIHNSQSFWREGLLNEIRYISDSDSSLRYVVGAQLVNQEILDFLPIYVNANFNAGDPNIYGNSIAGLPLTQGLDPTLPMAYVPLQDFERNVDALGIYMQVNLDLSPQTELTLAYRYDRDSRDRKDNNTGAFAETTFTGNMPKFSIAHNLNDQQMLYGTVSKGWRSGGFNKMVDPNNPDDFSVTYKPEELWSFEVGYKSTWDDDRGKLNVAIFTQDVDNHQAFAFQPQFAGQVVFNIPEGTVSGIELESSYLLSSDLEIGMSIGLLESEIESFDPMEAGFGREMTATSSGPLGTHSNGEAVLGSKFPSVDHRQINMFAQYSTPTGLGDLTSRIDWTHGGGKQWFIVNGQNKEGSRNLVQASVMLSNDNFDVMFWAENLLDEQWWASYEPISLHSLPQDIGFINPGRRYGVTATYTF
tara:strand:+ start:441 stop:2804 length:2364 start_codon:yes stop_codon:yes gene_type:complete